jgi:hypothetical protein
MVVEIPQIRCTAVSGRSSPTLSCRSVVATMIAAFAPAAGTAGGATDAHQDGRSDSGTGKRARDRHRRQYGD